MNGRPLRRRYWVRDGSPLWALMCLLDGIDWIVQRIARLFVETEVLLDRLMYVSGEWREARIERRRRNLE